MPVLQAGLTILHLVAGSYWLVGLVILALILRPLWHKYQEYFYFQNYGLELLRLLLKTFNVALAISLLSGAALMALRGRSPWEGVFGLVFSLKMLLIISILFLVQPALRYPGDTTESETTLLLGYKFKKWQRYAIGGIAFLLFALSVLLRYL